MVFRCGPPLLRYRGDRMLEDQYIRAADVQQDRKFIKALNAPGNGSPLKEMNYDRYPLAAS